MLRLKAVLQQCPWYPCLYFKELLSVLDVGPGTEFTNLFSRILDEFRHEKLGV
jgi:hypothetical protein